MLTPPGLKGKQYRISGKAYPRLSRPGQKRRRVLQIVAAVVAVALVGWGTVQLVTVFGAKKKPEAAGSNCTHANTAAAAGGGDAAKPGASASAHPSASGAASPGASASAGTGASGAASASASAVPLVVPNGFPQLSAFTVNVYNATGHAGLAAQTAASLKQRGFTIGKIGNAPATLENKITGSAQITGGTGGKNAMTLLGSELSGATATHDTRADGSVDLYIGNGFTALVTPAQAAQALAVAASPSPTAGAHC
ncbi:LytR C-terminal domain-containing protein [Streptacidiphilus fuscans]|uniref:LytR C-terminal domain-containing protein n=1 Tax=Streptacidiphilus fuscans TaxID=2789292 RepID=A0A931B3X4_9ACTN|nr:LytR C-terminal domain-containing protein [Streptacidiphilus fuscans]MBF9070750.1 LytR C-terminal domain-containing protein [Streptacidiphilus fuscans]